MKVTKCKACGNIISKNAKVCPHCGEPQKKHSCLISILLFSLGILSIGIILGIFYSPTKTKKEIQEIRICIKNTPIYKKPDKKYPNKKSGKLLKGEELYVLEKNGNWLKFRVTRKNNNWYGWIEKKYTMLLDDWNLQELTKNITLLKKNKLILKINPQLNEAYVNPTFWKKLSFKEKEKVAGVIAFYCGYKKRTHAFWADIKDYYSGKRLAKYSQVFGFKTYK